VEWRRVEIEDGGGAALDPSFFNGRLLIEILAWDWRLHVGLSHKHTPRKYRFQRGLDLVRSIHLEGRILAPQEHRGHDVRVHFSPFGPRMKFGRGGMDRVGWFYLPRSAPEQRGYSASLLLPEADLALLGVALNSRTKYLHLWMFDVDIDQAKVRDYGLSSTISDQVKPWAGVE
jgi:hypothetical protein